MGVQKISTDFKGPLPRNSVGLLIGHSSSTLKGLVIHPGVIDPDYEGEVQILASSPRGIAAISPGDRIAQLVIIPSFHEKYASKSVKRGAQGFGSTGNESMFLSLDMEKRPLIELQVNARLILGLLDTGADRSIIAMKDWPSDWPIQASSQTLQGLGYAKSPDMSARELPWKDAEGHKGTFQPYVLELPVSLWGRDLLQDMNYRLTNEGTHGSYSSISKSLMKDMGWHPSFGLGKQLQGRREPIQPSNKDDQHGLGFS